MSLRKGNIRLAVANLKSAKARSFLTMLGIVIAVMAVICTVSIGQGVKHQISNQVGSLAKGVMTVRPGSQTASNNVFSGGGLGGATQLLNNSDLNIVRSAPGVSYAVPLAVATGSIKGDHEIASPFIVATSMHLPDAINQTIQFGGFIDTDGESDTVVLGQSLARKLFDDPAPLGQTVEYRGKQFIVTGIFNQFNNTPFSLTANFNDAMFISFPTAQRLSGGSLGIYQVLAKATDPTLQKDVAANLTARLVKSHGGTPDVSVLFGAQNASSSDQTIHLLTLLIFGVAAISLLVGGVGIMDVMLVSITERMHEIGLRKAIGATNRQILRQFVTEALVLSFVGAVIGVVLSLAVIGLLRVYTSLHPLIVWQSLIYAPLVAVIVGVFFGTIPALKAARKDPIEALRHE